MGKRLNAWKIIFSIGLLLNLIILAGCIFESDETIAKRRLKEEYGEDFIIHHIGSSGNYIHADVSPKNDPTLVYKTRIPYSGDYLERHMYRIAYGRRLIKEYLEEDIKGFFGDCYIYIAGTPPDIKDEDIDFRGQNIYEYMANSKWDKDYPDCTIVRVFYVDEKRGNWEQYAKEYEFFSKQVGSYIDEGLMGELCLVLIKLPKDTKDELEEYMKTHGFYDNFDSYNEAIWNKGFIARFYDIAEDDITYITEEEYIEGREKLDNE